MKRLRTGLTFSTGVDSIGRINRAILETQNRINALKNFTGFEKPFDDAKASADGLASSISGVIAQALKAREAVQIPQIAAPVIPKFDNIAAGQAALDRITASIEKMGQEAAETRVQLVNLGNARFPLTSLTRYRAEVLKIKQEIAGGITPKLSVQTVDPKLSPRITADLKKSLADLTAQAQRFREGINVSKSSESIARYGRALDAIEKRMLEINKISGSAANGLGRFGQASGSAGLAVTNLGRVLQDAPFGFIGIANNLNPLLESFQRLRAETGSTGKTLKALSASLIGAGGIGLALSAVTFVAAGGIDTIKKFFAQFGDANKNITKAKEFLAELRSGMQIRFEASGSVQGEIAEVAALAKVVRDETAAKDERLAAIERLKKINKSYFGDLSLEKSSIEGLKSAQEDYTKALIEQAVIKGFSEEISKASVELFNQKKALAELGTQVLKTGEDALKARRKLDALDLSDLNSSFAAGPLGQAFAKAQSAADKANKAYNQQSEIVNKLQGNIANYTSEINAAVAASLKIKPLDDPKEGQNGTVDQFQKQLDALEKIRTVQKDVTDEQIKGFRDAARAVDDLVKTEQQIFDLKVKITLRDAAKNGLSKDEVQNLIKSYRKQLEDAFTLQAETREATIRVKPSVTFERADTTPEEIKSEVAKATGLDKRIEIATDYSIDLKLFGKDFADQQEEVRRRLETFFRSVQETVNNFRVQAFASIGEGIGNAISGGSLQDIITPLITTIGDAIIQMGRAAIQAGLQVLVLKRALASLAANPAIAIGVGIAAVALGTALKNSFNKQKLPKFKEGGVASGPLSGYNVELHGRELIVPLDRLNGQPSLPSRDNSPAFYPSLAFSGDMFRIMLNKVDRRKKRI